MEFPVIMDKDRHDTPLEHFQYRSRSMLQGIHPQAVAIIERHQPYHSEQAIFWRIHDLARIDRHRRLNVAMMRISMLSWWGDEPGVWDDLPGTEGLEDGAVVGVFRWNTEPDPNVHFHFTCRPGISEGTLSIEFDVLTDWILLRVIRLRDELAPFWS